MEDEDRLPPTFVRGFHNEESVRKTTYRQLGETDMIVSKLSLGGGPLGGLYGGCDDATAIVQEALRNGVSLIDTSYWYGQRRSEEAIGKALKGVPRRAYYIATKVGRFELDYQRVFDFRGDRVLQAVDQSLKRLGVQYIDLMQVQIHDFEFAPSESVILTETLPALQMAKASGKVRHIGITGYPLAKMASILEKSRIKIDVVLTYCRGTMNDSSLGRYIKYFQQQRLGIINAAPTSMSLLTVQGPPTWHAATQPIKDGCKEAVDYCQSKGVNISKLANHYGMNFPGVHTTLVGAHTVEIVKENLTTSWHDLTFFEKRVRDRILKRYLEPLDNANWEGVEVQKYWRKLEEAHIPTLKHPHTAESQHHSKDSSPTKGNSPTKNERKH